MALVGATAAAIAGRDLPARQQALPDLLPVRGQACAPDTRLERARLRPLGFVADEYAVAVWGVGNVAQEIERGELSLSALFDEDMLGDDLEALLAESALMKRTFRSCAIIAGLIERSFPGKEKSRRELTI